jgi:Cd2+/Zn2+-exporting ATPase
MVTGDNKYIAESIAKELGIKKVISECFPNQKGEIVKELQAEGHHVLMIGDGINDAPALTISDVSVSSDTADMVFMNNKLVNLKKMINLSKKMRTITMENVIFSISVIVFLLTLNLFGLVEIPLGVLAHEGSTILVILNSLRLLIYKK